MDKVKIAVVGVGFMGFSHLRTYSEMKNCNVVGVVDKLPESRERAERTFRVNAYENFDDLAKVNEVDAVSIAVPTQFHASAAIPILEKGIDVLLEKPIAANLNDAENIIRAAKKGGAKLMVGHIERFNPMVNKAKEIIANQQIYFCGAYRMNPPGRSSDSVIIDLSTHDIDVLRYLLSSDVKKFGAESVSDNGVEKHVVINMTFENNVKAMVVSSLLYPIKKRELVILTKEMLLEGNYITQEINVYRKHNAKEPESYSQSLIGTIEYELLRPFIQKNEPLRLELEHFIDCVTSGKKPLISGEDGRRTLEIALGVEQLCKKG
ncbi:MAG: Gfo/Idh/MocA family oxidoreductase [Candidatus Aenigmatarchaeota archaeon]